MNNTTILNSTNSAITVTNKESVMTKVSFLKPTFYLFFLLSLILGLIYPLGMKVVSQVLLPEKANASLYYDSNGKIIGSELIGQKFDSPKYLWGRPSASGYDAKSSGGSNFGPLNPELVKNVQENVDALKSSHPNNNNPIPLDLVTASASGLDPHISPEAAAWQVGRIARERGVSQTIVQQIIQNHTTFPIIGLLGDPTVNVLGVNLELDAMIK